MANRIPAGELKRVVTIYQRKIDSGTTAYDSYGLVSASSTAWDAVAQRRAKIEMLNGNEAELARQVYPRATHRVILDYEETLDSTGANRCAIVYQGRYLHVGAVINESLGRWQLEVLCGEER